VILHGQEGLEDVVYLKNGIVLHGKIVEQVPGQSIRIRTNQGDLFFYKMDEIARITREQPVVKRNLRGMKVDKDLFMSTWAGLEIASLIPDQDRFCSDLTDSMNVLPGFSGFLLSAQPRYGFSAGVSICRRLVWRLFLQSEVSFAMKGMKISGEGSVVSGSANLHAVVDQYLVLNYLNIPVYAKFYILDKGIASKGDANFNLYLQAGPSIGFAVARKIRTNVSIAGISSGNTQNYSGFEGIDFTLDAGLGLELMTFLDLEFRYSRGLTNVLNKEVAENMVLRNSAFSLLLGFTWPVGN
jgi:hypothetical protein